MFSTIVPIPKRVQLAGKDSSTFLETAISAISRVITLAHCRTRSSAAALFVDQLQSRSSIGCDLAIHLLTRWIIRLQRQKLNAELLGRFQACAPAKPASTRAARATHRKASSNGQIGRASCGERVGQYV